MGLLDVFKKKAVAATSTATSPASPTFTVPRGHQVAIFGCSLAPRSVRTPGGVWLVTTGPGGDDQPNEIRELLAELETALATTNPQETHLAAIAGSLEDLCAPVLPPCTKSRGAVVLVLQPGSLEDWAQEPKPQLDLTHAFQRIDTLRGGDRNVPLTVYVTAGSTEARVVAALAGDLNVGLRIPEADGSVLAEVSRPEGVIVSALLGRPMDAASDVHPGSPSAPRAPPARSPRLHRLVMEVAEDGSPARWQALDDELRTRTLPLALMATRGPDGKPTFTMMTWPGHGPALPVYPDLHALHEAARATGKAVGTYGVAAMPLATLATLALEQGASIALNGFHEPAKPMYVVLQAERLRVLASTSR